jgi:hypothetical protein
MNLIPIRFISEPIQAVFDQAPLLEKIPGCPDHFTWRDKNYTIIEIISEWHNYQRKGRMARNMTPEHAAVAGQRGSWGVGQDYFRVRVDSSQIFDIYYDRAPVDAMNRKGGWFLDRELSEKGQEKSRK